MSEMTLIIQRAAAERQRWLARGLPLPPTFAVTAKEYALLQEHFEYNSWPFYLPPWPGQLRRWSGQLLGMVCQIPETTA